MRLQILFIFPSAPSSDPETGWVLAGNGEARDPNLFSTNIPAALWDRPFPRRVVLGQTNLIEDQSNRTQASCSLIWTF